MSNTKKLLLVATIGLLVSPAISHAGPFFSGVINQYKYTNLENVLDTDGNVIPTGGTIGVGDRFVGTLFATTDQSTAGSLNFVPAGGVAAPSQITGVFDLTIKAIVPGAGGFDDFLLVPSALSAPGNPLNGLGLPANTMLALYTQNGSPFLGTGSNDGQLYTDTTRSQIFTDATTGTLFGAYGYGSGYNSATFTVADAGAANIGYWYTETDGSVYNNGLTLLQSALFQSPQGVFNSNLLLSFANIPTGSQILNNAPPPGPALTTFSLAGTGSDAANSVNGGVTPIQPTLFTTQSQDPERIIPAVPEPSTLTLLSIGMSLFGLSRLRGRKKTVTEV